MKKDKNWPLWRNLIYSLILFGQIRTTKPRAKAIQGLVDKTVNKIKKGTVSAKREVLKILPQKAVVEKLTSEVIPKLGQRTSGYTRIIRAGQRLGDGATMVVMEWVKGEAPNLTNLPNETKEAEVPNISKIPKKKHVKTDKTK